MKQFDKIDRRDFLKLAGLGRGGIRFRPGGLRHFRRQQRRDGAGLFFVQPSDTHWGFSGAPNPTPG